VTIDFGFEEGETLLKDEDSMNSFITKRPLDNSVIIGFLSESFGKKFTIGESLGVNSGSYGETIIVEIFPLVPNRRRIHPSSGISSTCRNLRRDFIGGGNLL
tara:strand:+ start:6972 stop:7277 length:306 start_codon:yes stop_codon:yes gene_type:complete